MGVNTPSSPEHESKGNLIAYTDHYKDKTVRFILHVLEDEFGHIGFERPDIHDIPNAYMKDGGNFWLVVENDEVIGTIGLMNYGNGRGYLKRMYVDERKREQGIGLRLLQTLLAFARERGYRELYLGTTEKMVAAVRFYKKHGFERLETPPPDLPIVGDSLFLKLELGGSE
jgi:GNAT superfamily N-acetyltransferase